MSPTRKQQSAHWAFWMQLMQNNDKSNTEQAQCPVKTYYDRHAWHREVHEGDEVMSSRTTRKNKLKVQWDEPAIYIEWKLIQTM